jgi:hypothetical protein
MVVENAIFGTQQAVWIEGIWGRSVLEENIRNVALNTGGSQLLLCVGMFIQSSERQANGIVLRLPVRKLYWCRLHFWSEWRQQTHVSYCTPSSMNYFRVCIIKFLFLYLHCKKYYWDLHQNEKCHNTKI